MYNNWDTYSNATKVDTINYNYDYNTAVSLNWKSVESTIDEKIKNYFNNNKANAETPLTITNIEMLVPNKVMKVWFDDKSYIKVVCHDFDEFDIYDGCFIAIAKKLYGKNYTCEGIEYMAKQLSYQKKYAYIVEKVIKNYYKKFEAELAEKAKAEREAAIRANHKRKRDAYLKRRDERRRNERIKEMAEAIAMAKDMGKNV